MSDVTKYCDNTCKRLVGLKAGLYDVITVAEKVSDQTHAEQAKQLKSMVESIENGLEELRNQCPPSGELLQVFLPELILAAAVVAFDGQ